MDEFINYKYNLKIKSFLLTILIFIVTLLFLFEVFGGIYRQVLISLLLFTVALFQMNITWILFYKYKISGNKLFVKHVFKKVVQYDFDNLSNIKLITYSKYKVYYFYFNNQKVIIAETDKQMTDFISSFYDQVRLIIENKMFEEFE